MYGPSCSMLLRPPGHRSGLRGGPRQVQKEVLEGAGLRGLVQADLVLREIRCQRRPNWLLLGFGFLGELRSRHGMTWCSGTYTRGRLTDGSASTLPDIELTDPHPDAPQVSYYDRLCWVSSCQHFEGFFRRTVPKERRRTAHELPHPLVRHPRGSALLQAPNTVAPAT